MAYARSKGFTWRNGQDLSELPFNGGFLPFRRTFLRDSAKPDYQYIQFSDWINGSKEFTKGKLPEMDARIMPLVENPQTPATNRIPLTSFKKNMVVWCKTEQEWDSLMHLADAEGIKWASGDAMTKWRPVIRGNCGLRPTGCEYNVNRALTRLNDDIIGDYYITFEEWFHGSRVFFKDSLHSKLEYTLDKTGELVKIEESPKSQPDSLPTWKVGDATLGQILHLDYAYKTFDNSFITPRLLLEDVIKVPVPVSSPAKKENPMILAPLSLASSAVRRSVWSVLDWAFFSPIRKTVKPVGTVAQFTICYATLAFVGYLAYSLYSDPQSMVSWISEMSPVEIKIKD